MSLSELKANPELVKNVLYIERMCSILNVNAETLFPHDFPRLDRLDRSEINSILATKSADLIAATSPISADLTAAQAEAVKQIHRVKVENARQGLQNMKYQFADAMGRHDELQRNLMNQLRIAKKARMDMEIYERSLVNIEPVNVEGLFKDDFFKFNSFTDGAFDFSTQTVTMTSKIQSELKTVNFGIFRVKLQIEQNNLIVQRRRGNILVGGNYHPYISSSGDICWGDGGQIIQNLFLQGDYVSIFQYLKALLTTFSPDSSPYVGFDRFVAKQAELIEYERRKIEAAKLLGETPPEAIEEEEVSCCDRCGLVNDDCSCQNCEACGRLRDGDSICSECEWCDGCGHADECEHN